MLAVSFLSAVVCHVWYPDFQSHPQGSTSKNVATQLYHNWLSAPDEEMSKKRKDSAPGWNGNWFVTKDIHCCTHKLPTENRYTIVQTMAGHILSATKSSVGEPSLIVNPAARRRLQTPWPSTAESSLKLIARFTAGVAVERRFRTIPIHYACMTLLKN